MLWDAPTKEHQPLLHGRTAAPCRCPPGWAVEHWWLRGACGKPSCEPPSHGLPLATSQFRKSWEMPHFPHDGLSEHILLLQSKLWKENMCFFKASFYWYSTNNNNVIRAIKSSSTVKLFLEDESMKCSVLLEVFATETEQIGEFDNALMFPVLSRAAWNATFPCHRIGEGGLSSCCLTRCGFSLLFLHAHAQLLHKPLHVPSWAALPADPLVLLWGTLSLT